jgi:exosome complex exonuclease RRP6
VPDIVILTPPNLNFSRPLPQEMFDYARSDTHFLLYIYDRMRNLLLERGFGKFDLLQAVLNKSQETCLRTYSKEIYDPSGSGRNGWSNLIQKWHSSLNYLQLSVFKSVHKWRDELAREQDESPR